MKIKVEKEKNMFGKNTGEFVSVFGAWQEKGKTKEEAKINMENALNWYFDGEFIQKYNWINNEILITMYKCFKGYIIEVLYNGRDYTSSTTLLDRMTEREAEKYFKNYIIEYKKCI